MTKTSQTWHKCKCCYRVAITNDTYGNVGWRLYSTDIYKEEWCCWQNKLLCRTTNNDTITHLYDHTHTHSCCLFHHSIYLQLLKARPDPLLELLPQVFLQARCRSCHPTNNIEALKEKLNNMTTKYIYSIYNMYIFFYKTITYKGSPLDILQNGLLISTL